MSMIRQDIISKKLLLVYCINDIKKEFERRNDEINLKSASENFSEITKRLSTSCNLCDRVRVVVSNTDYMLKGNNIEIENGEKIKKELKLLLSFFYEKEKNLHEIMNKAKDDYIQNRFDVEKFLSECQKLYIGMIDKYEQFLYVENRLTKKIIDIWKSELTECKSYTCGKTYKFLVHATDKKAEDVKEMVLGKSTLICTSYITDKHTMTYLDREYGVIYDIDIENLLFMSDRDNKTIDFEISLSEYDFSLDNNYLFRGNGIIGVQHITHNIGKTYMPEQLLSTDYNEVVLINNEYTIPRAVFVFNNATEFGKRESQKLAQILNLNIVEIIR